MKNRVTQDGLQKRASATSDSKRVYLEASIMNPHDIGLQESYAILLLQERDFIGAIERFSKLFRAVPTNPRYPFALASAYKEIGEVETALVYYDQAIYLNSVYFEAFYNKANLLGQIGRSREAISSYQSCIKLNPKFAAAYQNLGNIYLELGEINLSIESYNSALSISPKDPQISNNLGNAHKESQAFERAIEFYKRAVAIDPNFADAHFNKALLLLLLGKYREGWRLYEWRWKTSHLASKRPQMPQTLWLGEQSIANKSILLIHEQGLGDTIQFARFVKPLKALGANISLLVQEPLYPLLKSSLSDFCKVLSHSQPIDHASFDFYCPLLSLPSALDISVHSIPSEEKYLQVDNHKIELWKKRLGEKTKKLRVGVVWSGRSEHNHDHNRSITLQQFQTMLIDDVQWVSLQKEVREQDKDTLNTSAITHWGEDLKDFSDTAALCELMDIVVSVDTSVAHLAAALGRPTWILLPKTPDFRWLLDRFDSPWYPSALLFRQIEHKNWETVITSARSKLKLLYF